MTNLNKVLLIGNLTRDPELRYTQNGTALCDVRLAVNRRFVSQNGESREETCFIQITIFGKRGEAFSRYFQKGKPAFIEGRLKHDQWDDKQTGQKRSKISVIAEDWQFVGPAPAQAGGASKQSTEGEGPGLSSSEPDLTGESSQPAKRSTEEETPF